MDALLFNSVIMFNSRFCLLNCTMLAGLMLPDCRISKDRCCSPDADNFFAYYTCMEGKLRRELCQTLYTFNPQTLECDREQRHCKKLCKGRVKDGRPICGKQDNECCVSHSENCNYFFTCSNQMRGLSKCPIGSGFHNRKLTCVKDYKCSNKKKEIPRLCNENLKKITCKEDCYGPSLTGCSEQYYRCKNGQLFMETCPKYTRFNNKTIECDQETYLRDCNDYLHNFDTQSTTVTKNITVESTTEPAVVISKNYIKVPNENNKSPAHHKKRITQKKFNMVYGGTTIIKRNSTSRSWLRDFFNFFKGLKNNNNNETQQEDDIVRQRNIEN